MFKLIMHAYFGPVHLISLLKTEASLFGCEGFLLPSNLLHSVHVVECFNWRSMQASAEAHFLQQTKYLVEVPPFLHAALKRL